MTITDVSAADSDTSVGRRVATVCGLIGAALAAGAVVVLGDPLRGAGSGAAVTESLVSVAGRSQLAALLAATGGAALVVASVAMGARSAGAYGRLLTIGRGLTTLLMAAYFAAFGGGAVVSTQVLDEAGAGVGEATLVGANMVALVRYTAGLLLLGVAAAAGLGRRPTLSRWVGWSALALLALLVVPMTGWAVALVLPVWLGVVAAASAWCE